MTPSFAPRFLEATLTRHHRGQSVFEFVLLAPVMVIIMMLVIEFGMLMFGYIAVVNGVREGARYGALNCGNSCTSENLILDRVRERAQPALNGSAGSVSVWWCERSSPASIYPTRGDTIVVSATRYHQLGILGTQVI